MVTRRQVLVVAVLGLAAGMACDLFVDRKSAAFLDKVAQQMSKSLPKMVDAETEWVASKGLEGVLVYNYRLVQRTADQLDPAKFVSLLQPTVTKTVCGNPDTRKQFFEKGVTLRFTYSDKAGVQIATFDVTPKDCGL